MRLLGTVFIVVGVLMCLTVIMAAPGLGCIGIGCLLKIAGRRRVEPGEL